MINCINCFGQVDEGRKGEMSYIELLKMSFVKRTAVFIVELFFLNPP